MDFVTLAMAKQYTDSQRLGWEEERHPVLDITAEFTNKNVNSNAYPGTKFSTNEKLYEFGFTSYVYWDGVLYPCKSVAGSGTTRYIGNYAKQSGTGDTGEPFCFMATSTGMWNIQDLSFEENGSVPVTHTIQIYDKPEVIHKIDPKFLPEMGGGGLPVLEFTTDVMNSDKLTDAEITALAAAMVSGMPIIVSCPMNEGQMRFNTIAGVAPGLGIVAIISGAQVSVTVDGTILVGL